jgi:hypothetical protein
MSSQNQNDTATWQLIGIAQERQSLQSRLDYLNQQERSLRGRTGRVRIGPEGAIPTRKRVISDEQRQKMREAQQARWAKVKGEQAQTDTPPKRSKKTIKHEPQVESADA